MILIFANIIGQPTYALAVLASGGLIGFSVAAPIGPMAVLCLERTLKGGMKAGISTGAGASTVQMAYGAVVLLGIEQVQPWLMNCRSVISVISAGLMLTFAWRILRRTPRAESGSGTGSVLRSYGSAVALNSLNPMLPGLLFGVISIVIGPKPLGAAIVLVLFGMFLGSLAWWVMLSAVVSTLRLRLSFDQMRSINGAAAAGMVAFAALSLTRGLAN